MPEIKIKSPSVVLIDIETSPLLGYAWQTFDTNILKVVQPVKTISVAWKELYDTTCHVKAICDYKSYKKGEINDEELIREIWGVLDKADIVVGHNANSFDVKRLNARFVYYGLSAPSSYKVIDTLSVAKKYFKFDSNSLNNLGVYLGIGEKIENGGFGLWLRCIEDGDPKAWGLMKRYNVGDIDLLEKVYLALRPYMTNHPNMSAISGSEVGISCPTCQSPNVMKRGFQVTRTGRKQRYSCNECGSWSSGSYERVKNILSNDED